MENFLILVEDGLFSALAAVGLAVLFNVPVRALIGCAVAASVGHSLRTGLIMNQIDIHNATLIGAAMIGILSEWFARRWRMPASVFAVSAAIPMIPGSLAYRALMNFFKAAEMGTSGVDYANVGIIYTTQSILILLGIAFGIALSGLFFRRK